jgi:hypothetical protein
MQIRLKRLVKLREGSLFIWGRDYEETEEGGVFFSQEFAGFGNTFYIKKRGGGVIFI